MKCKLFYFIVFVVSSTFAIPSKSVITNNNHKVYLVFSSNENESQKISELEHQVGVDFWDTFHRHDQSARIMVAPDKQSKFESYLMQENIKFVMLIDDVESIVKNQKLRNDLARSRQSNRVINMDVDDIYNHFWNLDEVNSFLDDIVQEFGVDTTLFSVGKTFQDREIKGLKISTAGNGEINNQRPIIIVDATIHAREWIATMQAIHLIYQLTVNRAENSNLLDELDWIIIPVVNPDGFAYTHAADTVENRFWRKTRSVNEGSECLGVDPNRNFDFGWDKEGGASDDPCSNTYRGPTAASEIEIQGMQKILTDFDTVRLYLTLHSYGKYLLYPFGHEYGERIENWEDHEKYGKEARYSIYAINGTYYELGNSAEVLYKTTGSSSDYAAGKLKTKLTYVAELPGGGTGGFDIEEERIKSVLSETFPGIKTLAEIVKSNYPVK